jgi:3-dehydroquinate synthase
MTGMADNDITHLQVALGPRSYPIHIGSNLLDRADQLLADQLSGRQAVILSDSHTGPLYAARLTEKLAPITRRLDHLEIAAGEASKSMTSYADLMDRLLGLGVDRQLVLIALGGGVVGDLTGFAAASLLRGVDFVQIPTSLLAQVDSSVGGKTGINMTAGKNLVGAFWQPRAVLADLSLLASLPERELRAGYAETVKYGLLGDADFFSWAEAHGAECLALDPAVLGRAVYQACRMKAEIVGTDETESDRRMLLNLGHSFGHALEAEAGYDGRLLHGEAVSLGMVMAFDFSVRLGLCEAQSASRVRQHLARMGLPVSAADLPAGLRQTSGLADRLTRHMAKDKKVRNGRLRLVLVRAIGAAFVAEDISGDQLSAFLADWVEG